MNHDEQETVNWMQSFVLNISFALCLAAVIAGFYLVVNLNADFLIKLLMATSVALIMVNVILLFRTPVFGKLNKGIF